MNRSLISILIASLLSSFVWAGDPVGTITIQKTGQPPETYELHVPTTTPPPVTQPTPVPTELSIGVRAVATKNINVRRAPGIAADNLIGMNPAGSQGEIVDGPEATDDGTAWWNINFDSGHDGWCGHHNLAVASGSPTTLPIPPPVTQPTSGEKPGLHNTGPTRPDLIKASAPINVTTDGAVIENLSFSGMVSVNANNVTFRNCIFDAKGGPYNIKFSDSKRGLLVEDSECKNATGGAIYQQGYTARRLNVHDMGSDGFKAGSYGNVVIEFCYVTRLGTSTGSHADGVQVIGGPNHTIRGNNFDMPINVAGTASNACLFISSITGQLKMENVLVEGNWLNGGNYTVKVNDACTVRNNLFGRSYRYGIKSGSEAHLAVWENNRWMDTNQLIP